LSSSRHLPKFLLILAAIVASLALAACGDDGDTTTTVIEETVTEGESTDATTEGDTDSTTTDGTGPDSVTREFLLALANGDGATACSYTSADAIAEIELQGSCEEAVVAAAGEATEEDVAQVEDATYEISEQTETSASVTATRADGNAETFNLVLEDGAWKIDG
jgi:hypothetical protein